MEKLSDETPEERRQREREQEQRLFDEIGKLTPEMFLATFDVIEEDIRYEPSGEASAHALSDEQALTDFAAQMELQQSSRLAREIVRGCLNNYIGSSWHGLKRDVENARRLFTAGVSSPFPTDRLHMAKNVGVIAEENWAIGIDAWDRLLRDANKRVRGKAWDLLNDGLEQQGVRGIEDPEDIDDDYFAAHGLDWRDVTRLTVAHIDALRGDRLIDPAAGKDMARLREQRRADERAARQWILANLPPVA